jgi:hypothetical protein
MGFPSFFKPAFGVRSRLSRGFSFTLGLEGIIDDLYFNEFSPESELQTRLREIDVIGSWIVAGS